MGGGIMRAVLGLLIVVVMVCSLTGLGQEGATPDDAINLSIDRTFGVGMQLDFPFGGLLSGRYWFSPDLAGEVILFLWGDGGEVEGTITGRVLVRIADRSVVDFYGALGASVPITPYGWETIFLSAAGGIEFGFRFAQSLAWNIEFGIAYATDGELGMVFGTGIHFYF